ncbi:hypothetical protein UFOVP201_49 [uncultured Caudovirales phage]|uniref:Uncharacterized protein n=1 Tax=uncultured Caudovirales phage TaxID=2100421 RepID=A0A6J7WJX3_9CAUD|nr:hypothetical protein UFOVP201_49 [uncultured Caudovirales phage]
MKADDYINAAFQQLITHNENMALKAQLEAANSQIAELHRSNRSVIEAANLLVSEINNAGLLTDAVTKWKTTTQNVRI